MNKQKKQRARNIKQAIILLVILVAAVAGLYYYNQTVHDRGTVGLVFEANGKSSPTYRVKVAAEQGARTRGLMFVRAEELQPNRGMIFVFPEEKVQSFWMKDTYSPLDMIFVDKGHAVVGIVENATPFSTDLRSVNKPSTYVVELLAGTAKRDGIATGSLMKVDGVLPPGK